MILNILLKYTLITIDCAFKSLKNDRPSLMVDTLEKELSSFRNT